MNEPTRTEVTPLIRGIGLWQATALNVTLMVGAGVFATIPSILGLLPGPYAILAWLAAGLLVFLDSLVWSELGASMPRSGGSYQFLLESYGREKWGRLMAFLFIWQFMVSGPLEIGSGLAAIALFSLGLSPEFAAFDKAHSVTIDLWKSENLAIVIGPARTMAFFLGIFIVGLLYRRVSTLGKLTVLLWAGLLGAIGWIVLEGLFRFNPEIAFDFTMPSGEAIKPIWSNLGPAMMLAIYSFLGYYNVCYLGEEVREPAKVIPRAIILSGVIGVILYVAIHLSLLGYFGWKEIPAEGGDFNLPAEFMRRAHGDWAASLISLLLIGCCFASAFSGLLSYSRVPYGAAREGHFFRMFDRVHPVHLFPHRSLILVGALTIIWAFFDLSTLINALITTRLLEMFCGQIIGLLLLRKYQPNSPRPWKMWLYPVPALMALSGWLYLYLSSNSLYIWLGAGTLASGFLAFFIWTWVNKYWPFAAEVEGRIHRP